MTNSVVTGGILAANALAVVAAAAGEFNPVLEALQNGASVGAIMAIFLWREARRAERYEKLYDAERKLRIKSEQRCTSCAFVRRARSEFMGRHSSGSADGEESDEADAADED